MFPELSAAQNLLVPYHPPPSRMALGPGEGREANVEAGGQVRVHGAGLAGGGTPSEGPPPALSRWGRLPGPPHRTVGC